MGTKELDITREEIPSSRLVVTALSMLLTSLSLTIGFGFLNKINSIELMKYSVYTIIMNFVIIFYLYQNQKHILRKSYSWWFISFCYLISVGSVLLLRLPNVRLLNHTIDVEVFPFWFVGIALLALFVDTNLAMLLSFGMAMFTYTGNTTYEGFLLPLILSLVLCILAKYLARWIPFVCTVLVTLSLYVTILVIQHDFKVNELFTAKNIGYYACIFLVLLLSFILGSIAKNISSKKEYSTVYEPTDNSEMASSVELRNEIISKESNEKDIVFIDEELLQRDGVSDPSNNCFTIQEVINLRFPLMRRLEEESPKLFLHSKTIAYLSQKAAECIGARDEVAFAGGLYHEIGRLLGPDYIKNGEELATQYKLPKEVSDMIRQHNFKVELPKTKEAAIVMLSDNIMSTILYLKNSGETSITAEKVVENTFSIRLNKGTLDESGISLKEFHILKEFYITQYTV